MITIDASVLVAAGAPDDPMHEDAASFLAVALAGDVAIHQPTLSLVEVSAAIARRTGDAELAARAGALLVSMPGLVLHPLDLDAAADAAAFAGHARLRGADAIYAATARSHGATLVTLDEEQGTRAGPFVEAMAPGEWLARVG